MKPQLAMPPSYSPAPSPLPQHGLRVFIPAGFFIYVGVIVLREMATWSEPAPALVYGVVHAVTGGLGLAIALAAVQFVVWKLVRPFAYSIRARRLVGLAVPIAFAFWTAATLAWNPPTDRGRFRQWLDIQVPPSVTQLHTRYAGGRHPRGELTADIAPTDFEVIEGSRKFRQVSSDSESARAFNNYRASKDWADPKTWTNVQFYEAAEREDLSENQNDDKHRRWFLWTDRDHQHIIVIARGRK
ncbi:MAG: hypothetical protein JO317_02605 [Verrucomicrobiae bacterium]|nr:hypothetical protein [Verrucomicrobiae bacterium]